jgi:hypothetical protein
METTTSEDNKGHALQKTMRAFIASTELIDRAGQREYMYIPINYIWTTSGETSSKSEPTVDF